MIFLLVSSSAALVSLGNVDEITYEGEIPGDEVKVIHFHTKTRFFLLFTVPMCFWWLSFISLSGEFVINSAAAVWFFSKEKSVLDTPIWKGFKNLFGYHMGSVLLASILVPMFRVPRALLGWCKG
jgi:hypothetical protein